MRIGTYASKMVSAAEACHVLVEGGQLAEDDQQHHGQAEPGDQADRPPPGEPGLVEHDLAERGAPRWVAGSGSASAFMPLLLPCAGAFR